MFDKTDYSGKTYRLGWTEKGIVGFVFLPMGLMFLLMGALLYWLGAGEDPDDPFIFLATFGSLGLVFAVIGAIMLAVEIHRRSAARRAIDGGRRVMGTVCDMQMRNNVRAGNRSPWVVCVRWEDEAGVVHIFRSRYLYFNPQGILTSDQVPVYIEENGGGYFVDIDAVLPEIRMH